MASFGTLFKAVQHPYAPTMLVRHVLLLVLLTSSAAFVPSSTRMGRSSLLGASTSKTSTENPYSLTPELRKIALAFEAIGDDKLRYKQLLYMAGQLPAMDPNLMIPENKVPGCLSTVYIDATARNEAGGETVVDFVGDSDGLLTKGLVALLVRGLSGSTPDDIAKVDPKFIEPAGIAASLTPGRNNGFLNMMAVMKKKAQQAVVQAGGGGGGAAEDKAATSSATGRPMYDAIVNKLQKLQPVHLELVDNSHQHAGHAGAKGTDGESHFSLTIVADAFDGLNAVKRHQLVYMMLGEIMPKIHALQIRALTPSEAGM